MTNQKEKPLNTPKALDTYKDKEGKLHIFDTEFNDYYFEENGYFFYDSEPMHAYDQDLNCIKLEEYFKILKEK